MHYSRGILGRVSRPTTPADNVVATLLTAMVYASQKDLARIGRLGERATADDLHDMEEAARFLRWCEDEFRGRLRGRST